MERKKRVTYFSESEEMRKKWGWFFIVGLLLMALGMVMIGSSYTTTLFSVVFLGFFLIVAGIVQLVHAFLARKWKGLFLSLLLAFLYGSTGALCIFKPSLAAVDLTFIIAIFCFVGGLFKMITSLALRFDAWGWLFFNGFVSFILGCIIYSGWPLSCLWVIGTFVGVDILLVGWAWVMLALQAKKFFNR